MFHGILEPSHGKIPPIIPIPSHCTVHWLWAHVPQPASVCQGAWSLGDSARNDASEIPLERKASLLFVLNLPCLIIFGPIRPGQLFFLNICIRTSLVKPPARWELQQFNPTIFADGSGGWAWHFLLGPPSFFPPPNCWSEVQSLKNMWKYHDRVCLKEGYPIPSTGWRSFSLWKLPLLGEYTSFSQTPK